MARGWLFVVVKVVVPDQFFPGGNVAHGEEPDAAFDLIDLAVGIAGVVQVSAEAFTIDNRFPVVKAIQIRARTVLIAAIRFFGSNARARIFDDTGTLADRGRGIDPDRVNGRRTNDKRHVTNFA